MRNFWNKFCNSFWNTLKEQQVIGGVIETVIWLTIFSFITHLFFNGEDSAYISMVAGATLFTAICNQRRLDKK
jgi:ABC-type iron transport system FetAB permease component